MKKKYIEPTTNVLTIKMEAVLQSASLGVGEKMNSGEGDARGGFWDDEE